MTASKTSTITLRITPEALQAIDKAAKNAGQSRTQYMIKSSLERDQETAMAHSKALDELGQVLMEATMRVVALTR